MKAKSYLQNIRKLDRRIENKKMALQSLYGLVESVTITPKEVDVMSSKNDYRFEDTMAKIVDMQKELENDINKYVDLKLNTIRMINEMENDVYAGILMRRYVNYEEWQKIADDLGYTRQGINKKHGLALLEFEKCIHEFT